MKYPLDTEVWLWMQAHPDRIGHHTLSLITDEQNKLLLNKNKEHKFLLI